MATSTSGAGQGRAPTLSSRVRAPPIGRRAHAHFVTDIIARPREDTEAVAHPRVAEVDLQFQETGLAYVRKVMEQMAQI